MRVGSAALICGWLLACAAGASATPSSAGEPPPGAGERATWLREHAIPLRSIDPGDEEFADLRPLVPVLAGVRVVVLGEATHGDGSAFLAKARLVRFLHRELGFDVLAFESGFYDCWKAWQLVQSGAEPTAAFAESVFPIWTRSAQVRPLIDHFAAVARSARPLELAGIDPQFSGELAGRHLDADLRRLAATLGMAAEPFAARVSGPLANLVEGRYEGGEVPPAAARAGFVAALAELEQRLRDAGGAVPEARFWQRFLRSTTTFATSSWATDFGRPLLEQPESYQLRETLMGEHLVWLARERMPERRIIVWTHDGHAFRGVGGIDVPSAVHTRLYRTLQPAGAVAHAALGAELYTVGVVAYQGHYATVWDQPEELLQPTAGSLEDLLHRSGSTQAFLDLRRTDRLPAWLRAPLIARPIGYREMRARWPEVFDGLLFLDRMLPSTRVPDVP